MNTSKIIKAYIGAGTYSTTEPITQGDYGYMLQIEGAELPSTYRVDFSNNRHEGEALTVYGNENGAEVPEELIATGKDIFAFYYYIGENFGKTAYTWKIPNDTRAKYGDRTPTPTQQDSIDQLIVRSNEAVGKAEQAKADAETAQGKAEDAQGASERAKQSAEQSANEARQKAESITGLVAEATTLPEGSSATAYYSNGTLTLGIPKGDTGDIGPQGIQGPKGDKGDKGDQGIQGIQGPKGDKGDKGDTGPQGVKGDTGATGPQGLKGDKGDTGEQGPQGEKGDKGDKGDTGATGAKGEQGERGLTGQDGISPTVTITPITGGHRITITDADGEHSADVMDGTGNVDDVQINGTSILSNGVANVPIAGASKAGVIKINLDYGINKYDNGIAFINKASDAQIKSGIGQYRPIVSLTQHQSVFYGLAKAAGDTTQSQSSNAVGSYTDEAKSKIQDMIGIDEWKLVAEETLAEDGYFDITIANSAREVYIYAEIEIASSTISLVVEAYSDSGTRAYYQTFGNQISSTKKTITVVQLIPIATEIKALAYFGKDVYTNSGHFDWQHKSFNVGKLNRFRITAYGDSILIPTGSIVRIFAR